MLAVLSSGLVYGTDLFQGHFICEVRYVLLNASDPEMVSGGNKNMQCSVIFLQDYISVSSYNDAVSFFSHFFDRSGLGFVQPFVQRPVVEVEEALSNPELSWNSLVVIMNFLGCESTALECSPDDHIFITIVIAQFVRNSSSDRTSAGTELAADSNDVFHIPSLFLIILCSENQLFSLLWDWSEVHRERLPR